MMSLSGGGGPACGCRGSSGDPRCGVLWSHGAMKMAHYGYHVHRVHGGHRGGCHACRDGCYGCCRDGCHDDCQGGCLDDQCYDDPQSPHTR